MIEDERRDKLTQGERHEEDKERKRIRKEKGGAGAAKKQAKKAKLDEAIALVGRMNVCLNAQWAVVCVCVCVCGM